MTELTISGEAATTPTIPITTTTAEPAAATTGGTGAEAARKLVKYGEKDVEIPDQFWDGAGLNVEAVLKANADLRKQVSGMPAAPDAYDFATLVPEAARPVLGDVLSADAPLLGKVTDWGKKHRLTPEAMSEAMALLAERETLLASHGETEGKAASEQAWKEAVELVGSKEKAEGIGRRFAAALGLSDKETIGIPPKALVKLDELLTKAGVGAVPANRGTPAADAQDEATLKAMMQDQRYWKTRDPAYIAKVSEGFRKLYGAGGS